MLDADVPGLCVALALVLDGRVVKKVRGHKPKFVGVPMVGRHGWVYSEQCATFNGEAYDIFEFDAGLGPVRLTRFPGNLFSFYDKRKSLTDPIHKVLRVISANTLDEAMDQIEEVYFETSHARMEWRRSVGA